MEIFIKLLAFVKVVSVEILTCNCISHMCYEKRTFIYQRTFLLTLEHCDCRRKCPLKLLNLSRCSTGVMTEVRFPLKRREEDILELTRLLFVLVLSKDRKDKKGQILIVVIVYVSERECVCVYSVDIIKSN